MRACSGVRRVTTVIVRPAASRVTARTRSSSRWARRQVRCWSTRNRSTGASHAGIARTQKPSRDSPDSWAGESGQRTATSRSLLWGDTRRRVGVGRAAAVRPDLPNPHRVLLEGGRSRHLWKDSAGRGPEECRRRLEAEGITFDDNGAGNEPLG